MRTMSVVSTWVVTAEERSKHEATFLSLKPSNGRITGEQAKTFFLNSNLPPNILGQIWNLSDLDKDGQMTQQEFSIAMHLIQCKLKGMNLPTSLPLSLKTSSRGNVAAILLNPSLENGFNSNPPSSQNSMQTSGWSSSFGSGQTHPAGWSVGLANNLPPALLPVNSQIQTSAPTLGRSPTSSSMKLPSTFGMPTSNGLIMSSVSMPTSMSNVGPVMSSVAMPVSSMSGLNQSMRQQPVARRQSYTGMPSTTLTSDAQIGPISSNSRLRFNQLFKANDYEKTGFLTGEQSRKIFLQSLLPPQVLAEIWNLCDVDKDGQLSMEEFAIGMHLVESAKNAKPLPSTLPSNLLPQQFKKSLSENNPLEADDLEGSIGGQLGRQRSTSSTSANDDVFKSANTFEDKRKQNFERGRLELDRRRQEMQDLRQKEKDDLERKERLDEERKQRAKLEAEQKRQAELEKQREQQLEMERDQEALRKKMIQQRLQTQIEAERQRQLEWEKRKKEELLHHKSSEKDIVNVLQIRKDKMILDRDSLDKKIDALREHLKKQKKFNAECIAAAEALIKSRERKIAEIAELENKRKLCNQQLPGLSSENDRLQRESNKRESSIMDEACGNALSSIQDSTCGIRRQISNKSNLIGELETKKKMTQQLNDQLKETRSELQRQMDESTQLRQTLETRKNDYQVMKVRQEEEKKKKRDEESKQRREADVKKKKEEEVRKQKEREMEAMRLEREQQRLEQERRQKLQEHKRTEDERQRKLQEQQRIERERQVRLQEQERLEEEKQKKLAEQQRAQEEKRLEKEKQRKLQEAQANEAKRLVQLRQEDLVSKDKIIQEQTTLLAKPRRPTMPAPFKISENEAEVRKKVQEMQKKRNEQKMEKASPRSISPAPPTQSSGTSTTRKEYHKVVYPFSPRNPDELPLVEGDVVFVFPDHPKVPPGWVYGECKEKKGLFPANYAENIPDSKGDYIALTPSGPVQSGPAQSVPVQSGPAPSGPAPSGPAPSGPAQSRPPVSGVSAMIAALNSQKKLPISVTAPPTDNAHEAVERENTQITTGENKMVFSQGLQAVAIYLYRGKTDEELTFNKNDIITVKEQKDMSWFGELNGKTGWFPKSYAKLLRGQRRGEGSTSDELPDRSAVQIPSSKLSAFTEVPDTKPKEATTLGECVALYAYSGEAGDLCFTEGDIITITKSDGDWWEGTVNGQSGIFPANYVKRKEAEAPKSSNKRPEIATVITAYTATSAEQLSLVPGQYIAVKTKNPNGWWEGQLQARGKKRQSGLFPENCVKLLSSGGGNDSLKTTDGSSLVRRGSNTTQSDSESVYSVPSSMKRKTETLDQVLAMFSYNAQNNDELTFYKGSVITVLNREGDWWKGELNGQVGMFPNNYVQPLTDLPTTTQ